jgi:hypothetical protein
MSFPSSPGSDGTSLTGLTGLGLGDGTLDVGGDDLADPGLSLPTGTKALAAAAILTTFVGLTVTRDDEKKRTAAQLQVLDGALDELYA